MNLGVRNMTPTPKKSRHASAKSAGRPKTACHQCSSLKIRCTGEKPSCFRCRRLFRPCTWPKNNKPYPNNQNSFTRNLTPSVLTVQSNEAPDGKYGIAKVLLDQLIDLYFSHVYNASLLFHRKSFIRSIADGSARKYVVLSVCAMASSFRIQNDDNDNNTALQHNLAHEWAAEAGKLALSEAEDPTEDNLITFLTLALFWSSRNDWQRVEIHSGAMLGTFRALGFPTNDFDNDDPLGAELSRRRLWACFIISQFCNWIDCASMEFENFEEIPMPCDDLEFETDNFRRSPISIEDQHSGNFYTQMIRLSSIWPSVCRLAHNDKLPMDQKLISLQKLDSRLKEWEKGLPSVLSLGLMNQRTTAQESQAIMLHTMYHQIMCTLHSSIVPLFSFFPQEENYRFFKSTSAQTALFHARQISAVFSQGNLWNRTIATGFLGYAAYCSTAIQMPFLWCEKEQVRANAHSNIVANLDALHAIGRHWKLIATLVDYVPSLYKYHKEMAYSLPDEPHSLNETDLDRHLGKRIKARASILGYNRIYRYRPRRNGTNGTEKLSLDLDDINSSGNEDSKHLPKVSSDSSIKDASSQAPAGDYFDNLDIHELFSDAANMETSGDYFSMFPHLGGSLFDAGQVFLPDTMDFPSLF